MNSIVRIGDKLTKWIDAQNEIICLKICSTYYRKVESGYTTSYFLNPRFYALYFFRLLILLVNLLRLNDTLYRPDTNALKNFNLKNILFSFLGLRHFTKSHYQQFYYDQQIKNDKLHFETQNLPLVSIIIPVYNQIEYTKTCLKSISLNISTKYSYEVIVIDDASTDETQNKLVNIPGLRYIRNEHNIGFLNSCNKAIHQAKGKFI